MKIKLKVILCMCIAFLVFSRVGSAATGRTIKKRLTAQEKKRLSNITESVANTIELFYDVQIKTHLKAIAKTNLSIIKNLYKLTRENKIKIKEAKKQIRQILLSQTIGKTGYVYTLYVKHAPSKIRIDIHPKLPIGMNVQRYNHIKKAFKTKNGYFEYKWKNPGELIARTKAGYVMEFKPWNVLIVISTYKSEFTSLLKKSNVRKLLKALKVKNIGFAYIMNRRANLVIHPQIEGRNVYHAKSADGKYFIRQMLLKRSGIVYYKWKSPTDVKIRQRVNVFRFIKPLKWIFVISMYLDEVNQH